MNKYAIGTVIGSALLGLAKSRGSKSLSTMPMQVRDATEITLHLEPFFIDSSPKFPINIPIYFDQNGNCQDLDIDAYYECVNNACQIDDIDFSDIFDKYLKPTDSEIYSVYWASYEPDYICEGLIIYNWNPDHIILTSLDGYLNIVYKSLDNNPSISDKLRNNLADKYSVDLYIAILKRILENGFDVSDTISFILENPLYGWSDMSEIATDTLLLVRKENGKLVEYENQKRQPFEQIRRK